MLLIISLSPCIHFLTHWGRVTHICVSKLTNIDSDNGLSPGRRQTIIWTNVGILLIRPLVTNFSEFLIGIHTFLFKKMHLKMPSAKWRPFCLDLNVLMGLCVGKDIKATVASIGHAVIQAARPRVVLAHYKLDSPCSFTTAFSINSWLKCFINMDFVRHIRKW